MNNKELYEKWLRLKEEEDRIKKEKELLKEEILKNAVEDKLVVDDEHYLGIRHAKKIKFSEEVIVVLKKKGLWEKYSKLDVTKLAKDLKKKKVEGIEKFAREEEYIQIRIDSI